MQLATKGSAQLLHRHQQGELKVGAVADLALFSMDEPRFSGSHDPLAALVLCGAHQAESVMVAGQWKIKAKQWLAGDIHQIMAEHQQLANQLLGQL